MNTQYVTPAAWFSSAGLALVDCNVKVLNIQAVPYFLKKQYRVSHKSRPIA